MSYNTSGWNFAIAQFINTMIITHSLHIVAIQEHWQLEHNMHKISNCFDNFEVFSIPASKPVSLSNKGRPSGGIAFIISNNICDKVKRINPPNSTRVSGISINISGESYVYINCYFPVDPQNNNMDTTELLCVLQDIRYIIESCDDNSHYIVLGDINAHFTRDSIFVYLVKSFLTEYNLSSLWDTFNIDYTYSFSKQVNGIYRTYTSVIDHFCVGSELLSYCNEAFAVDSPINSSSHKPIIFKLQCNINICKPTDRENNINNCPPKPLWKRATPDNILNYRNDLQYYSSHINSNADCFNCVNPKCSNPEHINQLDTYACDLMDAISISVDDNIPTSQQSGHKVVPGWSKYVHPFREDANFWHSVWVSAGKPLNTNLHTVMKHTRNKYHYAVRKIRKYESLICKNKFLEDCLSGNINNIFAKIKSDRKGKSIPASSMDGVSGSDNIASLFRGIYDKVYNKHSNDVPDLLELLNTVNNNISVADMYMLDNITDALITNIIDKLEPGKNDVNFNWGSDAIKHGSNVLASHFKNLFKGFIVHGHISKMFTIISLIPLLKDKKGSKFSSSNYRLIAISSIILKLLDHIIITLYEQSFISPHLQFGYHKGLSTTICTWTMLECINIFTNNGSSVYLCLLDLTKAFDHVKHSLLFKKLSNFVSPLFLRWIIISYMCQSCFVTYDQATSSLFNVSNGVRQGAVASPHYFNIYLNDLFLIMKQSGFGCYIDCFYYGLLGYADDCALLSPTRAGLQSMLDICVKYFAEHGIDISVDHLIPEKSKTKCMAFNVSSEPYPIILNNLNLPWVNSAKHLGCIINVNGNSNDDIFIKKTVFVSKHHSLRQELGVQNPDVFMTLVQTYLCAMYGSCLWDLFSKEATSLYTKWNNLVRNTYNLPFKTHRYIVNDLCIYPSVDEVKHIPHLRVSLIRRFLKFYNRLESCHRPEVVHLFNLQKCDRRSIFGRNCMNICNEYNVTCVKSVSFQSVSMPIPTNENDKWRVPFIRDILCLRFDDNCTIPRAELDDIINFICCD